jgi:beta-ribofuranosylaminobenzene 5'-phosphate synthase
MFSVFQGGVFNVKSAKYIDLLTKMGIIGVGQSSWGPTVYGVVESMEKALVLEAKLRELVDQDALILATSPRNKGAEVTIDSP